MATQWLSQLASTHFSSESSTRIQDHTRGLHISGLVADTFSQLCSQLGSHQLHDLGLSITAAQHHFVAEVTFSGHLAPSAAIEQHHFAVGVTLGGRQPPGSQPRDQCLHPASSQCLLPVLLQPVAIPGAPGVAGRCQHVVFKASLTGFPGSDSLGSRL